MSEIDHAFNIIEEALSFVDIDVKDLTIDDIEKEIDATEKRLETNIFFKTDVLKDHLKKLKLMLKAREKHELMEFYAEDERSDEEKYNQRF